jgi:hypothetical protein
MLQAFELQEHDLTTLLGASAYAERRSKLGAALLAIQDGLQRRDLLSAAPGL